MLLAIALVYRKIIQWNICNEFSNGNSTFVIETQTNVTIYERISGVVMRRIYLYFIHGKRTHLFSINYDWMTGLQHSADSSRDSRTFTMRSRTDRRGRWSVHPPKGSHFPSTFFFVLFNAANVPESIFIIRLWLDRSRTLIPGGTRRFHRHRGSTNPQWMSGQQSMSSNPHSILYAHFCYLLSGHFIF